MISVEDAIEISKEVAKRILKDRGSIFNNLLVEEFEQTGQGWAITLGWDEPVKGLTATSALKGIISPERVYKVFYVDAETGTVTKMKFLKQD